MACSKVFGYQHFSDFLLDKSPKPTLNLLGRNRTIKGISRLADTTLKRESIDLTNTPLFYSLEQTSYLQHAFLALKANRSSELYKKCTLHTTCRYTRFEHFLCDLANTVLETPQDLSKDFPWITEHFVQRFYNECLSFEDFMSAVKDFYNFETNSNHNARILCWDTYYREHDGVIAGMAINLEHNKSFLSQLFGIFVNLDTYKLCETSPFLIKHFLLWWLAESGISSDKALEALEVWSNLPATENTPIDFIEFLQIVYKILFQYLDKSVRIILLRDAHDCIVKKIIRKGLLAKAGPNMKGFKVRWMILFPNKIIYYKRKNEESMDFKGTIVLGPSSSVREVHDDDKKEHFLFTVYCSDTKRKFMLRADDPRIRISWVASIQKTISVLKGVKGSTIFQKELVLKESDYIALGLNSTEFVINSTSDYAMLNGNNAFYNSRGDQADSYLFNPASPVRENSNSFLNLFPNHPNPLPSSMPTLRQETLRITDIDSIGPDRTSDGLKFRQTCLLLSSDSDDDEPPMLNSLLTKSITAPNFAHYITNRDAPPLPAKMSEKSNLYNPNRSSTHKPFIKKDSFPQEIPQDIASIISHVQSPANREIMKIPSIPSRQTPILVPPKRVSSLNKHV